MSIKLQYQESYQKKLTKLIEIGRVLSQEKLNREHDENIGDYCGYYENSDIDELARPEQYDSLSYRTLKWQKQCQHLFSKIPLESTIYSELLSLINEEELKGFDIQKIVLNLEAILEDLKDGIFENIFLKVEARSVINHLEQAQELFDEGKYSLAGIVSLCSLESFLREIAIEILSSFQKDRSEIPLNGERAEKSGEGEKTGLKGLEQIAKFLRSKEFLTKENFKAIKSWIDIRNKVVHGDFESVTELQIRDLMINIKHFVNSKI